MAPISPRLRRVLLIVRQRERDEFNASIRREIEAERREWADYNRRWNIPDDVTPESGDWP